MRRFGRLWPKIKQHTLRFSPHPFRSRLTHVNTAAAAASSKLDMPPPIARYGRSYIMEPCARRRIRGRLPKSCEINKNTRAVRLHAQPNNNIPSDSCYVPREWGEYGFVVNDWFDVCATRPISLFVANPTRSSIPPTHSQR